MAEDDDGVVAPSSEQLMEHLRNHSILIIFKREVWDIDGNQWKKQWKCNLKCISIRFLEDVET